MAGGIKKDEGNFDMENDGNQDSIVWFLSYDFLNRRDWLRMVSSFWFKLKPLTTLWWLFQGIASEDQEPKMLFITIPKVIFISIETKNI